MNKSERGCILVRLAKFILDRSIPFLHHLVEECRRLFIKLSLSDIATNFMVKISEIGMLTEWRTPPRRSAVKLRSLGGATARHCGTSNEFCEAISTHFCFTYSLAGVTAMPRRLHARLCHAFLVSFGLSAL